MIAKLHILGEDRRRAIYVGNMFLDAAFIRLLGGDANYSFILS